MLNNGPGRNQGRREMRPIKVIVEAMKEAVS